MTRIVRAAALCAALSGCFGDLHPPRDAASDGDAADRAAPDADGATDDRGPDAPADDVAAPDAPPPDAGDDVTAPDAADAAAPDVLDAPPDAGFDAPSDGAPDASVDAARDASVRDVAPSDATFDASGDGPTDPTLAAPRPISPLSVSRVRGVRARLEWQLPPDVAGAQVDVCADRACRTTELSAVVASGATLVVPTLAPGFHFWRVRGHSAVGVGARASATWEFYVPPRGAATGPSVETPWGAMSDFNGDGRLDLLAGAPQALTTVTARNGEADVFLGNGTGFDAAPAVRFTGATTARSLGLTVASIGDVDGDGFGDLAVGSATSVQVWNGASPAPLPASFRALDNYTAAAPAGDVNHDGYGDVLALDGARVSLYLGGAAGLSLTPARSVGGLSGVGVGDVDRDGFDDVAVQVASGRVSVYSGGIGGLSAVAAYSVDGPRGYTFGAMTFAGDLNADGVGDLVASGTVVGGAAASVAVVMPLVASALSRVPAPVLVPAPAAGVSNWGFAVAAAGDVNGDGVDDFAVGTGGNNGVVANRACVYAGSASGPATTPMTCVVRTGLGHFGAPVGGVGDHDGDGFEDLAVGMRGSVGASSGTVRVFRGRTTGVADVESATLTAGDSSANFGAALAGWQ